MSTYLAHARDAAALTAVAALPVTVGCVIWHAYLAATAALLLSAVAGACGWVLAGRYDTPAGPVSRTTTDPSKR